MTLSGPRDSQLPETSLDVLASGEGEVTPDTSDLTAALSTGDTQAELLAPALDLDRGQKVGRYVVLDVLGAGGMGIVYRAYDPELDRQVALKVLSPRASGDGGHESRLYREAQALARLSHENVVSVHDVGTYEGRIFVAMELIDGTTLNRWLRERARTRSEILRVFRAAGRGLSAAHQADLVHRDFKPTNVMVGKDGRVRVLDFGLARATHDVSDDREASDSATRHLLSSPLTAVGVLVGTPHYMAPEQLRHGGGSARSDQFCFCVTLWEALCGRRPYAAGSVELLLLRLESGEPDPPPADAKLPGWLKRVLLRGLAPDPAQRYPTMDALLADLGKDPARRQRRLFGMGLAALITGLFVAGVMSFTRHRSSLAASCAAAGAPMRTLWSDAARAQVKGAFAAVAGPYGSEASTRVTRALDAYAAEWSDMSRDACRAVWVQRTQSESMLDRRAACLERGRQSVSALLERFVAADVETVTSAVPAVLALPEVKACGDLITLSSTAPPRDPAVKKRVDTARAVLSQVAARDLSGHAAEGLATLERWAPRMRAIAYPPLHIELDELLARLRSTVPGHYQGAEAALDDAMRLAATSGDDRALSRLWVLLVGILGNDLGRPADALAQRRSAELAFARAGVSPADALRASLLHNLALAAWRAGRAEEASRLCQDALRMRERVLGAAHPDVGNSLNLLAILAGEQGDLDAAGGHHAQALAVRRAALGDNHPFVADSLDNLGVVRQRQGRIAEALALHEQALVLRERVLGPDHTDVGTSLNNVGSLRLELGQYDVAGKLFERVMTIWRSTLPPGDVSLAIGLINQGDVALGRGDASAAQRACEEALAIEQAVVEANSPSLAWQYTCLGEAALLAGRAKDALPLLEKARGLRADALPIERARTELALARALLETRGDRARALELARGAHDVFAAAGELGALRLAESERLLRHERAL